MNALVLGDDGGRDAELLLKQFAQVALAHAQSGTQFGGRLLVEGTFADKAQGRLYRGPEVQNTTE